MSERDPQTTPAMQFEVAEYTAPQAGSACSACKNPLTDTYYTGNGAILCDQCHAAHAQALTGGSPIGRVLAATGLGLLAGLAGAAIWFAVRRISGYEIGLIAILVGLMVGVAVRKGCRGRGGWFYQTLAIVLTYSCISAQYVPDIVEGFMKDYREGQAAEVTTAGGRSDGEQAAASPTDARSVENADRSDSPGSASEEELGGVKLVAAVIVFAALAFVLALAIPFLGGVQNLIGLLIIGFALYEAWKINKRTVVQLAGPFQLSPAAPPPVPAAADV